MRTYVEWGKLIIARGHPVRLSLAAQRALLEDAAQACELSY